MNLNLSADRNDRERFLGAVAVSSQENLLADYRYRTRLSRDAVAKSCLFLTEVRVNNDRVLLRNVADSSEAAQRDNLTPYTGKWVALSGLSVIAHGHDAADVVRRARLAGVERPHVLFVEARSEGSARLGF